MVPACHQDSVSCHTEVLPGTLSGVGGGGEGWLQLLCQCCLALIKGALGKH